MTMKAAISPNNVAREALRQLATSKQPPTPENFRRLYYKIAGTVHHESAADAEQMLERLAAELSHSAPPASQAGHALAHALDTQNWGKAKSALLSLAVHVPSAANEAAPPPSLGEARNSRELRELLAQVIDHGIRARLLDFPELAHDAKSLSEQLRHPDGVPLAGLRERLESLCNSVCKHEGERTQIQEALLGLLRMLVANVGELVTDDEWMRGQIDIVVKAISVPLNLESIEEARRTLRDLVFKTSVIKHGLTQARDLLKQMVSEFIDNLGELSTATGDYHDCIESLSQQLRQTDDIEQINRLLAEVLRETRTVQSSTLRAREEVLNARAQVDAADRKIRELEAELQYVSQKSREDFLTGTLNRQGLSEALHRAMAIAQRKSQPLAVALLDIDNFKAFNDNFGHKAGDDALVHLANVIKESLRPEDSVARYGGEEFLVILPGSSEEQAAAVMARVQRELTKQIFLHENRKLLITFSAGIAGYRADDTEQSVLSRADEALYSAKRAGKNRVASV